MRTIDAGIRIFQEWLAVHIAKIKRLWVNSTNGPVAMPNINPQLPEKAMGKPFKVPKSH